MDRALRSGWMGMMATLLALSGCGREVIALGNPAPHPAVDGGSVDTGAPGDAAPPQAHPCTTDGDCAPYNAVCVAEKHECGECTEATRETQCPRARPGLHPQCDPVTNLCVECLDDEGCPAGRVCHPAAHFCTVRCTADNCFLNLFGVCGEGVCGLCRDDSQCEVLQSFPFVSLGRKCANGACVECLTDPDCGGSRSRCNANGHCF